MSKIFTKTYSGTIKRKISEGQLSPSSLPEIYIKKQQTTEITSKNIDELYPSKIFNIISKQNSVEITSNTLGLKLTNILFDGKSYFKKFLYNPSDITTLDTLDLDIYNDTTSGNIYINTDKDYVVVGEELITVVPVIGLQPWDINELVSIRRLKDRFKITVKNVTMDSLKVEIENTSFLKPTIKDNWVVFKDFIINYNNSYHYVYSHSFEYYDKKEVHTKGVDVVLRDQPLSKITVESLSETYNLITYRTYRSNLHINTELSSKLYVNFSIEDNTLVFKVSQKKPTNYFLEISKNATEIKEMVNNPFKETPIYKAKPENYYFVWSLIGKYNRSEDVPIGCERVLLDLSTIQWKLKPTFNIWGQTIYEDNKPIMPPSNVVTTTAPDYIKSDIEALKILLGEK